MFRELLRWLGLARPPAATVFLWTFGDAEWGDLSQHDVDQFKAELGRWDGRSDLHVIAGEGVRLSRHPAGGGATIMAGPLRAWTATGPLAPEERRTTCSDDSSAGSA